METGQFPAHQSDDDTPTQSNQPGIGQPFQPAQAAQAAPGAPEAGPMADPNGATWPSLPPAGHSDGASTSAPRPPYDGYNPWGASASATPSPYSPPPPTGGGYPYGGYPASGYYPPITQSRQRTGGRIPSWIYILAVAGILGGLAVGIGLGRASGLPGAAHSNSGAPTLSLGASSPPVVNVPGDTLSLQQSVESVAKAVQPSVVEITSTGQGQQAIGSGNIITKDGYIVTNDHVVDGFDSFVVTYANGTSTAATVIGTDPQDDLAVVKVNATNLPPIAIGDSSQAQVGEFVVALGTPLGQRNTSTFGIVSALNRTESEAPDGPAGTLTGLIQTSAPINPGNSGGALVDLKGELIGIPTLGSIDQQGTTSTGIGFAIPSNQVKYISRQLIQGGHLTQTGKGFLGIEAQDVTPDIAAADGLSVQSGVLVQNFANDAAGQSPAQRAGLRVGDVIIAVNGQPVTDNSSLVSALAGAAPGTTVRVTVARGNGQQDISVTLGERPVSAQG